MEEGSLYGCHTQTRRRSWSSFTTSLEMMTLDSSRSITGKDTGKEIGKKQSLSCDIN